jgi:hypothetical protein
MPRKFTIALLIMVGMLISTSGNAIPLTRADLSKMRITLKHDPLFPAVQERIKIDGMIYFTSDAYTLESTALSIEKESIFIDFAVSRGDFAAGNEILIAEPFHFEIDGLAEGGYKLIARVNGIAVFDQELLVWETPPEVLPPDPIIAPEPIPFFKPSIRVLNEKPMPDDAITLQVIGYLPDTAHAITQSSARVDGREITLNMKIEASGIGAEVLVLTEQDFNIGTLAASGYYVKLFINDQFASEYKFVVGEDEQPIPEPKPNPNPYEMEIIVDPINPGIDEEFMIVGKGVWPQTGFVIRNIVVDVVEHDILITLEYSAPEIGGAVMVNFKEILAELRLGYGLYTVYTRMNDAKVEPVRFWVGQHTRYDEKMDDVISYRNEKSMAESPTWLSIDANRRMIGANTEITLNDVASKSISQEKWDLLMRALNDCDFANLPDEIRGDLPSGDGDVHVITYQGKMVRVYPGAELSEPLNQALFLLNDMTNELFADVQSAVTVWELY